MPVLEIASPVDCPVPTPVRVAVGAGKIPAGEGLRLVGEGGKALPAQRDGDGVVVVLLGLKSGVKSRYRLEKAPAMGGVAVKTEGHATAISLPEGPFTTYHTKPELARTFFYPLLGPDGKALTRNFPMDRDVPGEDKDHPHHRSFWTAYGEVNGTDDWSEEPKHGFIRHQKFTETVSGPVFGGFTATALWTAMDGAPLLDEKRSIRVYNVGPDARLFDYEVHLIAAHGDVHYGDTKEGGLLAFRVASPMDGSKGGRLENSLGGVGEKLVWGKPANWLDYSGSPEGPGTAVYGFGMMDHPGNLNYPCRWHARDYGLVGTNPFAKAAFEKGLSGDGHHQKKGETLVFRYRVLLHRGDAKAGHVSDAYHAWVQGPTGSVVA